MPNYSYKALLPNGKIEKGVISEASERAARIELIARNLTPLKLQITNKNDKSKYNIATDDLALLFRQASAYLSSGTNLDQAFLLIGKSSNNKDLKEVLGSIHDGLIRGDSLQQTLQNFPKTFNKQILSIIAAGSHSGNLDDSFQYLADYLDTTAATKKKIYASLSYPIFLLIFSVIIISVLLVFVLPQITQQFLASGVDLPLITRVMMFLSSHFIFIAIALTAAMFVSRMLLNKLLQQHHRKIKLHHWLLTFPILGKLLLSFELEKFSQALLIMLRSGLNFDQSFQKAIDAFSNQFLKEQFLISHNMVKDGKNFLKPIKEIPNIPNLFLQLFESGYQTGTFELSFSKVCAYLTDDIESKRNIFLSVLEPIMIVFMGLFVMLIVLAILTPMMQMNALILQ